MGQASRLQGRKLLASCLAMLAMLATCAFAASDGEKLPSDGLYMQGAAWGRPNPSQVRVYVEYIRNQRSATTNNLRLAVWLSWLPVARGGTFTGEQVAIFPALGSLPPGAIRTAVDQTASVTGPTMAGMYFLVLALEEYRPGECDAADGFCMQDWLPDTERHFWNAVTPPPPPPPPGYNLTVDPSLQGSITLDNYGTGCGTNCYRYPAGTVVTATAHPMSAGHELTSWYYACTGRGACVITMDADKRLAAAFHNIHAEFRLQTAIVPNPGHAGKDMVFRTKISNVGPSNAHAVMVRTTYDATAQLVWLSPPCRTTGAAAYECDLGFMAYETSREVTAVLRTNQLTNLQHNLRVSTQTVSAGATSPANGWVDPAPPANVVARYRLYSPVSLEHHFTTDLNEYNTLGTYAGTWIQEGMVGRVLDNPGTYNGVAAVPYYRLYDNLTRWHHWTTDPNEYYTLSMFPWWSAEGVDGYILPTQAPGSIPLYRLLYPFIGGLHHWTVDTHEYNALVRDYGWIAEGGSGFVIP